MYNKVLKDIINRYKLLRGFRVHYVPGFDCHGAAVEDFYSADSDQAAKIDSLVGLDRPFVIYCSDDDCGSSEDLAYNLQDWGFTNILVFKGGWKMWTESGYQVQ